MTSMLDRFRINGQVAVITGSGRGIGAACALAFADAGADVVLSARSLAELEETAARVRARGRRALVVPCDVMDASQREALVARAVQEFGRLDILVNNAGGWGPKPALETTDEETPGAGICVLVRLAVLTMLASMAALVCTSSVIEPPAPGASEGMVWKVIVAPPPAGEAGENGRMFGPLTTVALLTELAAVCDGSVSFSTTLVCATLPVFT